jgi:putative ABC transport system permease protein
MILKILKKDLKKNFVITVTLFIFICLSGFLAGSGSNMIIQLTTSIDNLFEKSRTPHFSHTHLGSLTLSEKEQIELWAKENSLVTDYQIVEFMKIDNSNIYFGESEISEFESIMDFNFVVQNEKFDFLLDLNNEKALIKKGEIGIPAYFLQQNNIKVGDYLIIKKEHFQMRLKVVSFVRDSMMNPVIVSSKRFLVNEEDYIFIKENINFIGDTEHVIEFLVNEEKDIKVLNNEYISSDLPKNGIPIDISLLKLMNGLTEGFTAAIIIFVSFILIVISLLCIRFTILSSLEEDFKEIGVMKAIGIKLNYIKKIYMIKYIVLSISALAFGYVISLLTTDLFFSNIIIYFGKTDNTFFTKLIPIFLLILIFLIVYFFSNLIFRKINKISSIDAIRYVKSNERNGKRLIKLHNNKFLSLNIFMALNYILQKKKTFILLFSVFILCVFMIILPVNLLSTAKSPTFIKYMGVGICDLRIDLQVSENIEMEYHKIIENLENDDSIEIFSAYKTYMLKMLNSEGNLENINVEVGNFEVFPLEYINGNSPSNENEIALSYLIAKDFNKNIGEEVEIIVDNQVKKMMISGIYQDITNGGKGAKALNIISENDKILRYIFNVNFNSSADKKLKSNEYSEIMNPGKVTLIEDYMNQTFDNIISQMTFITIISILISLSVAILITVLFLKMIIAKDNVQITIMKSIIFNYSEIKKQYIIISFLVLFISIIIGTIFANTLGLNLVRLIMENLGAFGFNFTIKPFFSYFLMPLVLFSVVIFSAFTALNKIKQTSISDIVNE